MNELKLMNQDFLLFVAGWEFSMIGDALLRFALPLYLLLSTGHVALMGTLLAWAAIPGLMVMPFGGILADRISKRKVMVWSNLLIAAMSLAYGILSNTAPNYFLTAAVLLALFTLEGILTPAAEAAVPVLVPADRLVTANSITFLLTIFSSVGAPILAGFMLERSGLGSIIWLSTLLFILAALVKTFAKIPVSGNDKIPPLKEVRTDLSQGIKLIFKEQPTHGRLIVVTGLASLLCAPIMSVALSVLVSGHFNRSESVVGLAQGLVVFGGTFGLVLIGILGKRATIKMIRPILLILTLLLFSGTLSLKLLPLQASFWVTMGIFFLILSFMTILAILTWSYLGENTEAASLGKVMSLNGALVAVGVAFGNGFYGFLFERFQSTPGIVFAILGIGSLTLSIFGNMPRPKKGRFITELK